MVLLGISCTDKISKKEIVKSNKMSDVIKTNSSSINSNLIIISKIKSDEVKINHKNSDATILSNAELARIEILRKKHQAFLNNSPFKKVLALTKKERKAIGIPPNKFYEQEWELSMNPETGRPHPENLDAIRNQIITQRQQIL